MFDALVSCGPSGLPADLLLSFRPDILTGALGVGCCKCIHLQDGANKLYLIVTDGGLYIYRERGREKIFFEVLVRAQ